MTPLKQLIKTLDLKVGGFALLGDRVSPAFDVQDVIFTSRKSLIQPYSQYSLIITLLTRQ